MMNVTFIYDEDKDVECLLSKGGGSVNSAKPTKAYEALLAHTQDIGNTERVRDFVRSFRTKDIEQNIPRLKESWDTIRDEYERRAEGVFGVKIPDAVTAYLTITGRHPYSVKGGYFYVPADTNNANSTCMHELWHFYTWHRFGSRRDTLGPVKYNEIKEALTVLLNIECTDLLAGKNDAGYPQHQNLRTKMIEVWNKTKDIEKVWESAIL